MTLHPITPEESREEIRWLEYHYGKRFLEKSLHEAGLRYRALTAPNAKKRIAKGEILAPDLLP